MKMSESKTRMMLVSMTFLTVCLLGVLGCAAGAGSRAGTTYSEHLGTGTLYDINTKSQAIFNRYQYRIEFTTDMLYIETEWKNRYPFDDEIELGIDAALTQIIIRATPGDAGSVQTITPYDLKERTRSAIRVERNGMLRR